MARKKVRTVADIVFDITVNEMTSGQTNYIHFGYDTDRNHVISGDLSPRDIGSHDGTPGKDWSVTIHANGTHTTKGDVPARILAQL